MSLDRRTQRLEEHAGSSSKPVTLVIRYDCPAEGGGTLIEERAFAPPSTLDETPVRYFFEPEGGGEDERRELTKEEYDTRLNESLPEPDHAP